jgi:hypothetical protein
LTFDALPARSPFTFVKAGDSEIDDRQLRIDTESLVRFVFVQVPARDEAELVWFPSSRGESRRVEFKK